MKIHAVLLLALAAVAALPFTADAAQSKLKPHTTHARLAAAATYECPICHHKVSAAQAKKLHYTCPMDQGKLAPVKTASLNKPQ